MYSEFYSKKSVNSPSNIIKCQWILHKFNARCSLCPELDVEISCGNL